MGMSVIDEAIFAMGGEDNKIEINKSESIRARLPVDKDPFDYNVEDGMLTIMNHTNAKIKMRPNNLSEFVNNIHKLKGSYWNPVSDDIRNNAEDLRECLLKEGYEKITGPINCDVYGVFNNQFENLLMLEIIYPYTGSRHINVALDVDTF